MITILAITESCIRKVFCSVIGQIEWLLSNWVTVSWHIPQLFIVNSWILPKYWYVSDSLLRIFWQINDLSHNLKPFFCKLLKLWMLLVKFKVTGSIKLFKIMRVWIVYFFIGHAAKKQRIGETPRDIPVLSDYDFDLSSPKQPNQTEPQPPADDSVMLRPITSRLSNRGGLIAFNCIYL